MNNNNLNTQEDYKNVSQDNSSDKSFFSQEGVKLRKDEGLKTRLRTLILERGMSEPEFFHSIGLTRQHWYSLSWGIFPCPLSMKIKIAQALGCDSSVIFQQKNNDEPSDAVPSISKKDGKRRENKMGDGVAARGETTERFDGRKNIQSSIQDRRSFCSSSRTSEDATCESDGSSDLLSNEEVGNGNA